MSSGLTFPDWPAEGLCTLQPLDSQGLSLS